MIEQFQLIATCCADLTDRSIDEKAKIIFQCLLLATVQKYSAKGNDRAYRMAQKVKNLDLSHNIRDTFEKTLLGTVIHNGTQRYQLPLYSQLLTGLLKHIKKYKHYDTYQNGDLYMPFIKIDLLHYLLLLAERKSPDPGNEEISKLISKICGTFTKIYIKAFMTESTPRPDHENKWKEGLTSWRSQYINEDILDISPVLLHLEANDLLDGFLGEIRFKFSVRKVKKPIVSIVLQRTNSVRISICCFRLITACIHRSIPIHWSCR